MKHSFTSARLLDIEQVDSQDYEYNNDKRRGIHVDLPPLTRFQPLVLSFGSNSLRGFIFVNFLLNIKISQVSLPLRVVKPRGVPSAISKKGVEPSSKNEVKGQSAARVGVLRFFRGNLLC
jgi:hypothetical protein